MEGGGDCREERRCHGGFGLGWHGDLLRGEEGGLHARVYFLRHRQSNSHRDPRRIFSRLHQWEYYIYRWQEVRHQQVGRWHTDIDI